MSKLTPLARLVTAFLLVASCSAILANALPPCLSASTSVDLYAHNSYAPLELVAPSVKVTYNLEAIASLDVAFEVIGPDNIYYNFTMVRQATTNASGIALISFTIPWPDIHPNQIVLGQWSITAKVTVANQIFSNTRSWIVGFLADFNGDGAVGPYDFARFSMAYGSTPQSPYWLPQADFDSDQRIGPYDLAFFSLNYGKHYP